MFLFKCDRCGKIETERKVPFACIMVQIVEIPYLDNKLYLCEQCYQTIKEVLEDGEIK